MINIKDKEIIIFDLDGTLTPSKSDLGHDMALLIEELIKIKKVAIISGGGYAQFLTQFINKLDRGVNFSNMVLLPTSGTKMYTWNGDWIERYAENFTKNEKDKVYDALNIAFKKIHYIEPKIIYGDTIEDRGSQITFSGLGQKAPLDQKKVWDPDRKIRSNIMNELASLLPGFDIRLGGISSIDITKKGVNKGYGIRKLEKFTGIPINEMLFLGDALYLGGNDFPAKASGVDCISVSGPDEVKIIVESWLKTYSR
jgi:HAD superfamily hydrolase (TIGR01484 family)